MEWLRGETIGHGSFSTVTLAKPITDASSPGTPFPPLMAVKSSPSISSAHLENERHVLEQLGSCPEIVRWFGADRTVENGREMHNLFLEHASQGSLAKLVKKSNGGERGGLPEADVRRFTASILRALRHIHLKRFAHCDLKLENVLMFGNGDVKISDFGLAMKLKEGKKGESDARVEIRGTPLYMAPESVNDAVFDTPADIWALGCCVVEMSSGKTAWCLEENSNIASLLFRIGARDETPTIPRDLSDEGRDFVSRCFVKDPSRRWTAEMLLDHPFVAVDPDHDEGTVRLVCDEEVSVSPRSPFGFPVWDSVQSSLKSSVFSTEFSPEKRIGGLVTDRRPDWSVSQTWVTVR